MKEKAAEVCILYDKKYFLRRFKTIDETWIQSKQCTKCGESTPKKAKTIPSKMMSTFFKDS